MKYVCIDDGAVEEIISGRSYQTVEFEDGARLIEVLSGRSQLALKFSNVIVTQEKNTIYFSTMGSWKSKKYLVIDCERCQLFEPHPPSNSLVYFQKLLRFCTKFWNNPIYSKSEKLISGTSKAVIFPLPFSTNSQFRIVVEREPMKERLKKREMDGKFLLAYKSGTEGGDSTSETPDYTNFRKAFERLPDLYRNLISTATELVDEHQSLQMASTELRDGQYLNDHTAFLPYEKWRNLLTKQQNKFVDAPVDTPHRLQGPAGTGKTQSLLIRCVRLLREAQNTKCSCRALFVTHSESTRDAVSEILDFMDKNAFHRRNPDNETVTLSVVTLASLCASTLKQSISQTEFIDRDAQDSKLLQSLYIAEAIKEARRDQFSSYLPLLSEEFRNFFQSQSDDDLSTLFQHEISVLIKGRAGDSFKVYKECPRLRYGLPTQNAADKGFVYIIFRGYQKQLEQTNQFDTDDVVLSAVGQLDTPIWRRRRAREGYDFIAVDETHLFNINELHVFHYFSREIGRYPISFSVDQAQAVGDRGWEDVDSFELLFNAEETRETKTEVGSVFRSSPEIFDFANSILASGATLFTNFSNTLSGAQSVFTSDEERRSLPVCYVECTDDKDMIETAFRQLHTLTKSTNSRKWEVLITSLSEELCSSLEEYALSSNKPVTVIKKRGDYAQVRQAQKSGHFVLGHVDYVGGLEFNAVVIVGVDKGRVPNEGGADDYNSRNYASYAAHNRLYVASSRAKFGLELLGVKARGPSDLLKTATLNGLLKTVDA